MSIELFENRDYKPTVKTMGWYEKQLYDVFKYYYQKEYAKALEELEKVKKLDPSYPGFTLAEAMILFSMKNFPLSLEKYETALAMDPNFQDYDFHLGTAYLMIGYIQYVIYGDRENGFENIQRAADMMNPVAKCIVRWIETGIEIDFYFGIQPEDKIL